MAEFEQRIEEILGGTYASDHDAVEASRAYNASFQDEGVRKARFVINRLSELDGSTLESLKNYVVLSVGGADGSDLLALVRGTPVRRAILLEYDDDAAGMATQHTKPLIEAAGGQFHVMVGDATQKLEALVGRLQAEKGNGAVGLLCVFFGVLHELPLRSPGFELRQYFARLTSVFDRNFFFLSEPCLPPSEQEELEVRVATINEDRLAELLGHVNAHLFGGRHVVRKLSQGYVRTGFPLIVETLHKLLRFDSIPRFRHEMRERLTQFTPNQFVEALRITLPDAHIERHERVSEGFRLAFQNAKVELRSIEGQRVALPFSHARVIAISLPPDDQATTLRPTDPVNGERDAGESATAARLDRRILHGDNNLFAAIERAVLSNAPRYLQVLRRARDLAETAYRAADRADRLAALAREVVARKCPKGMPSLLKSAGKKEHVVFSAEATFDGQTCEVGSILWLSHDEYFGCIAHKQPLGSGVYKIYTLTKELTANQICFYRGEQHGREFGPFGTYEFPNSNVFAGEWVDAHPRYGMVTYVTSKHEYDVYFGKFAAVPGEGTLARWLPHGDGVGVNLTRREAICGEFEEGNPVRCTAITLADSCGGGP